MPTWSDRQFACCNQYCVRMRDRLQATSIPPRPIGRASTGCDAPSTVRGIRNATVEPQPALPTAPMH
eukprot:8626634-Pyramimonas_sp.AAC.1